MPSSTVAARDHPGDRHGLVLADAVRAVGGLSLDGRVPHGSMRNTRAVAGRAPTHRRPLHDDRRKARYRLGPLTRLQGGLHPLDDVPNFTNLSHPRSFRTRIAWSHCSSMTRLITAPAVPRVGDILKHVNASVRVSRASVTSRKNAYRKLCACSNAASLVQWGETASAVET